MKKELSWKCTVFEPELDLIRSEQHRAGAEYIINSLLPDYFFVIRPSSTGKYHPECTHQDGGLVIHSKRLIYFALFIANGTYGNDLKTKENQDEKDMMIIGGIFHDSGKMADYGSDYAKYKYHPEEAVKVLKKKEEKLIKWFTKEELKKIYAYIQYHMGPWSSEKSLKPMEEYTLDELAVYYGDYLSAQKMIDTPVDNFVIDFETAPKGVLSELGKINKK